MSADWYADFFLQLVAVWLLTRWMAAGSPADCRIIELGPGRGTLMDDVLRVGACESAHAYQKTFQSFPQINIKSIHLVENSMNMRTLQKDKLSPRAQKLGAELHWEDDVDLIPKCKSLNPGVYMCRRSPTAKQTNTP